MQEEIFSNAELLDIIEEAKKDIYFEVNLIHLGRERTSIRGVAKDNNLIFAYGNEGTGYRHIIDRHGSMFGKVYWKENGKLSS